MVKVFARLLILCLSVLTAVVFTTAQDCPETVSCPTIQLPGGFTGDFFLGETLLAGAQNAPVLQLPPGRQQVIVRNIQSTEPNFNQLFVYQEATVNVSLRAGQSRVYPVRTRQQFIRGTLNFTCQIAGQKPGENVACSLTVDGVYRQDVAAGQSADLILDTGARAVQAQVIGEHAWLWNNAIWQQNVNIVAGRTARSRSQFAKLGHVVITLNQPGAIGDIYLNNELIASQANSTDKWVAPGSYTVDVRNITDPAGAGVYRWLDATGRTSVRSGQERAVSLRLKQELLPTAVAPACDCSGDTLNCTNFSRQSEAQACFAFCQSAGAGDIHGLDGNNDGAACESLP